MLAHIRAPPVRFQDANSLGQNHLAIWSWNPANKGMRGAPRSHRKLTWVPRLLWTTSIKSDFLPPSKTVRSCSKTLSPQTRAGYWKPDPPSRINWPLWVIALTNRLAHQIWHFVQICPPLPWASGVPTHYVNNHVGVLNEPIKEGWWDFFSFNSAVFISSWNSRWPGKDKTKTVMCEEQQVREHRAGLP